MASDGQYLDSVEPGNGRFGGDFQELFSLRVEFEIQEKLVSPRGTGKG